MKIDITSEASTEILKEQYLSPDKRQQFIEKLRLI